MLNPANDSMTRSATEPGGRFEGSDSSAALGSVSLGQLGGETDDSGEDAAVAAAGVTLRATKGRGGRK